MISFYGLLLIIVSNLWGGVGNTLEVGHNDNSNLLLGNPSNAVQNLANDTNYLISKPAFSLSYNSKKSIPNWVSWHLDERDFGAAKRTNNFRSDLDLPASWFRVTTSSYKSSGFDRGHNCPSADRTRSVELNSSTFLMTNIIPQAPNNNQGVWANLEEYSRKLVREGNELYIIMGTFGHGGSGSKGFMKFIDHGRIAVPSRIWKVILILKRGGDDLMRINKSTQVIAIVVPNSNTVFSDWRKYVTTVDKIEQSTGYDIFNKLDLATQNILESRHAKF